MQRNITLDYYKIFLSLLVILLYMYPLFEERLVVSNFFSYVINRIAVPTFFIINGYFLCDKITDFTKIRKYLLHIVTLLITWTIIYIPYSTTQYECFTLFIFKSLTVGDFHLWYLNALFGGVVFLYFLVKIIRNDYVILVVGIVIFILAVVFKRTPVIFTFFYQTGWLMGLAFITLGYYIKKAKVIEKLAKYKKYLFILVAISFIGTIAEAYITFVRVSEYFKPHGYSDLYFSFLILVPALFILVMNYSKYTPSSNYYLTNLSSAIYFVHLYAILLVNNTGLMGPIRFPIVVILSVLLSLIIIFLNKRIKIFL